MSHVPQSKLSTREELEARRLARRARISETQRKRRRAAPLKAKLQALKNHFGPTAPDHYLRQVEVQKGFCGLCAQPLKIHNLDHCHTTGKLRSILCSRCNTGLHYVENLEWRHAAERYLENWR